MILCEGRIYVSGCTDLWVDVLVALFSTLFVHHAIQLCSPHCGAGDVVATPYCFEALILPGPALGV